MRARLFIITGLAVATVLGASSAAHATPQGPGKLGPTPTTAPPKGPKDLGPTPTTQPPKGPDDLAPTPTTQPPKPKGPGDLAPAPKGGDNPKPKGPGDLAPAPTGGGTTNPSDPTDNTAGIDASVAGESVDTPAAIPADASHEAADAETHDSNKLPAFLTIFFALLVAALIAFVAMRMRSEDTV